MTTFTATFNATEEAMAEIRADMIRNADITEKRVRVGNVIAAPSGFGLPGWNLQLDRRAVGGHVSSLKFSQVFKSREEMLRTMAAMSDIPPAQVPQAVQDAQVLSCELNGRG